MTRSGPRRVISRYGFKCTYGQLSGQREMTLTARVPFVECTQLLW